MATSETKPGPSFDAYHLLRQDLPNLQPLPVADPDEMIIRWFGGSLANLLELPRVSGDAGRLLLHDFSSWKSRQFYKAHVNAGIYRVRLPILDSVGKPYEEQQPLLRSSENTTPVALIVALNLCSILATRRSIINELLYIRCTTKGDHEMGIDVEWYKKRIFLEENALENADPRLYISGYSEA